MKDRLTQKHVLLLIDGPSCGGKSTVADIITERYGGIFHAKTDRIKWLISDYEPKMYKDVAVDMTLAAICTALEHGLSVIKEGALHDKTQIINVVDTYNIPFFVVNVLAPFDVARERFEDRIQAKKEGAKIGNADPERFKDIYNSYLEYKIETPLEFDSSEQSPESIADEVSTYIQNNI